jgi:hypothetical protein
MIQMDEFTFPAGANANRIVEAYRSYGVVVIRKCLPEPVVSAVAEFLSEYLCKIEDFVGSLGVNEHLVDAGPRIQTLLQTSEHLTSEQRHRLLGHYPLEVRLSDTLKQIPIALARHQFLQAIHGTKSLFAHMPINARWILPHQTYAAVPPHQDALYNTHMRAFSVIWTPLCEIDEKCGGMAFYPGSGANGVIDQKTDGKQGDWLPALAINAPRVVLQPISPGDVVVFDDLVVHESMPNTSNRIRLNVETRMFANPTLTSKHYLNAETGEVVAPAKM